MEEEKKLTDWEDLDLNSEGADTAGNQGQGDNHDWDKGSTDKKTFTLEEVEAMKKEMNANNEKGVQKILNKNKKFERAFSELSKISDNEKRLVEIHDEDPELAKIILDQYFEWEDIEAYKSRIDYVEDYSDPKVMENKIRKEAERIATRNLVEEQKRKFIDKMKMEGEELENFENSFDELKGLKSFNPKKNLVKQFEKAYKLSTDDDESLSKLKSAEYLGRTMDAGSKRWANSKSEAENPFNDFFEKFKTNN